MHAMVCLWLLFVLIVFVVEPLFHVRFEREAAIDPALVLRRMARVHRLLLTVAAIVVAGAVAGAQGINFF
jgi:hypothetical protein